MQLDQDSIWLATLNAAELKNVRAAGKSTPLSAPDLLVLGSGIVGLATAYFAAERGLRVQVVSETPELAQDAECSLGCIIPNVCRWQFSPATQQLGQASRDWWAKLAVRPEFQIDWRVCGALMVDAARLLPEPRQHMLSALDEGYSVHDVDAEQVALLEPALSPHALGGLHYPSEAFLHPLKAASGFITGLTRRGGQITQVDSISAALMDSNRVAAIETSAGTIQAKAVFSADPVLLARLLGERFVASTTLESSRYLFASSEPTQPLLKRPMLDSHWVIQLKTGEVVIAVPASPSEDNDQQTIEQAIEVTRQLLPGLREVPFHRSWSGSDQRSSKAIPVVDLIGQCENVWSASGLEFSDVLFAPILGKLLVDWIQQGNRPEELMLCQASD